MRLPSNKAVAALSRPASGLPGGNGSATANAGRDAKAVSLVQALYENEELRQRVERFGDELAAVNDELDRALPVRMRTPEMESALDRSGDLESRIQESVDALSSINAGLVTGIAHGKVLTRKLQDSDTHSARVRHLAFYDSLTGLPNRLLFADRMKQVLAQAQRHARGLAVMFIDLDKFKLINDSHGHDVGDQVLQQVGQRLKDSMRAEDTVSRRGGDEFLCLMVEADDENNIAIVAQKMIKAISATIDVGAVSLIVRPSIGIAVYPRDGGTAKALVKNADTAMYQAKRTRKGYSIFSQSVAH